MSMKQIFAGLDKDGVAKLFIIDGSEPRKLTIEEWITIQKGIGAAAGELLIVSFERQAEALRDDFKHTCGISNPVYALAGDGVERCLFCNARKP